MNEKFFKEYTNYQIGLGHRRLSILDLSMAGHQPMKFEHLTIIYNGEVYNFLQLRAELEAKGHRFRSKSDTEVLIHGYEEEGIDFVQKLNGMFAFALWDAKERTLYLCRDRFGVKPLYWWYREGTFIFASEIKAILAHPRVSVRVNYEALNEYFTFQNGRKFFKNLLDIRPIILLQLTVQRS